MSKAVLAWLGVLFIAMGGTFVWLGIKYSLPAVEVRPSHSVVDRDYDRVPASAAEPYLTQFTLTERSGEPRGTADLAGKVSVTNFFFANCPGVCLTQQRAFETLQKEYGPKGVQFLSITCDPQNDTPSGLQQYLVKHKFEVVNNGQAWWLLTGELHYIERVAAEYYGVALKRFTHTEKFEVRDKWGNPRGSFSWQKPESVVELKFKLDKLLAETEPPAEVKAAAEERAVLLERAKANAPAKNEKPAEQKKPAEEPAAETTTESPAP